MLFFIFLLGFSIPLVVFGSAGDYDMTTTYCTVSKKFEDVDNVYNIQCSNSAPCCFLTVEQSCNKDGYGAHSISYGEDCGVYVFEDSILKFLSIYKNDTEKGNMTESNYEGCNIDIEITGIKI